MTPDTDAATTRGPRMLSVVLPALNEEEAIGTVLDGIPRDELKKAGWDVEIVVVDGESRDRTREISEAKGARVIVEPRRGYGRAYKTGFAEAKGDVIITGDADATYPFEEIPFFLELLDKENLDFINTNRFGDLKDGAMTAKHKFGNWVLTTTTRVLFLVDVRDSQSGMWIFRREVLDKITLTSDGMPLSEEIKIEAFRHPDVKAHEIPIEYRLRVGDVKLASWRDGIKNLAFLFKKRLGIAEPES